MASRSKLFEPALGHSAEMRDLGRVQGIKEGRVTINELREQTVGRQFLDAKHSQLRYMAKRMGQQSTSVESPPGAPGRPLEPSVARDVSAAMLTLPPATEPRTTGAKNPDRQGSDSPVALWRVVAAASSFALFGLGGGLVGAAVLPLAWLLGPGPLLRRQRRCMRVVAWSLRVFHGYMRLLRLIDFRPSHQSAFRDGLLALERESPVVVVCNHPTLVDTTAVLATHGQLTCVIAPWFAKKSLLKRLTHLCGHIVLAGDSLEERVDVHSQAEQRLREGQSLLLFPEGTRSPRVGLGPFQRGAFDLAVRCKVPVLPVAIEVRPRVLKGHRPWYHLPDRTADYRITPLAAVYPRGEGTIRQRTLELSETVQRRLEAHLTSSGSTEAPLT